MSTCRMFSRWTFPAADCAAIATYFTGCQVTFGPPERAKRKSVFLITAGLKAMACQNVVLMTNAGVSYERGVGALFCLTSPWRWRMQAGSWESQQRALLLFSWRLIYFGRPRWFKGLYRVGKEEPFPLEGGVNIQNLLPRVRTSSIITSFRWLQN